MRTIYSVLFSLLSLMVHGQTSSENYVKVMTARQPISSSIPLSSYDNSPATVTTDITYFDGLGRPYQAIMKQATPSSQDMVKPYWYDSFGRSGKDGRYYVANQTNGAFRSSQYTEQANFYSSPPSTNIKSAAYPYSEESYEASPIGRVVEHSAPGYTWRPSKFGGQHTVNYSYRPNINDNIRLIEVLLDDNQTMISSGNHPSNSLWVTSRTDENGSVYEEIQDRRGLMVCKKAAVGTSDETITYYVYDVYDRLTFVIPPQAVVDIGTNWSLLNNSDFREKWLFRYKYDHRNRMIEKQVPGSKKVEMVYDRRNRLVFALDGNRRAEGTLPANTQFIESGTDTITNYQGQNFIRAPGARVVLKKPSSGASSFTNGFSVQKSTSFPSFQNHWLYMKYDELNRPVITGIKQMTETREALQSIIDEDDYYDFNVDYVGNTGSDVFGYDNTSYPAASENEILTVTYYDNYDFVTDFNWGGDYHHDEVETLVNGFVTGGQVRLLNTTRMLNSAIFYDDRHRIVAVSNENYFGDTDKTITAYRNTSSSLIDDITTNHKKDGVTTTVTETFTYDHRDRLITQTHAIDANGTVTLASNGYNAIGELIEKNLHGGTSQSVDYRYNERGWLTTMNGGSGTFDDANTDKFGMELKYNNAPSAQYNGNIGQMLWKSLGGSGVTTSSQNYQYSYDNLNRLLGATYIGSGDHNVSNISYDENGNLTTIQRGTIDNLTFNHAGNQLMRTEDTGNAQGFHDVPSSPGTEEYSYDRNGNMITDSNKKISSISYNFLNLPWTIRTEDGSGNDVIVTYHYDAVGVKHAKTVNASTTETSVYVGPFHYKNNSLKFIQYAVGRSLNNGGSWDYEYDLKDHLGNIRITVDESGTVKQRQDYYPFGGTFHSSISSPEYLYKYNGKEEQKKLSAYDYGWRQYDSWIGRFNVVDAFSDKYYSMSPYQYGANNPILFVDINGDSLMLFENGEYVATVDNGKEEITGYNQISKTDKNGNKTFTKGYFFGFNDIEVDKQALMDKTMKVMLINNGAMENSLQLAGVNDKANQDNKFSFIYRESRHQHDGSSGKMDFWSTSPIVNEGYLHVARSKAGGAVGYNDSDFGNFLWGMAGRRLGFSLITLRLGAHYNNWKNGQKDNGWNPGYKHQTLDSEADQRAIINGYNYNRKFQENAVVLPRY